MWEVATTERKTPSDKQNADVLAACALGNHLDVGREVFVRRNLDIRLEDTLKLPLMHDQQVVEAFLPDTSHEAFSDRIGSWCINRRFK
jgi:hypothetical protein